MHPTLLTRSSHFTQTHTPKTPRHTTTLKALDPQVPEEGSLQADILKENFSTLDAQIDLVPPSYFKMSIPNKLL